MRVEQRDSWTIENIAEFVALSSKAGRVVKVFTMCEPCGPGIDTEVSPEKAAETMTTALQMGMKVTVRFGASATYCFFHEEGYKPDLAACRSELGIQ